MLVSPKWQTMWLKSQHCSKTIMNVPLPSQQAKNVLEDLRTNCCSPNKAVQLEALKCWGMWIKSQNPDDWKLNTVCFTAVRPLITKKMQPLHKDVDICKLKLSLMWALLVKVENIMQLEGPQYILEVFLQSCLSWLSSASVDGCENEISVLIFQLLLSILKRTDTLSDCDREMFAPLTGDILHSRKVFHRLADKFLNIFIHWRKVQDKNMFLKLWKSFLEHCELSCEHIPIPLWHKVFKLADQICSEKNEPVKERLAFLHSCATTLKSALSSSKFIDFGNLLTTPCEALLKKLVELCTVKCTEFCDWEMFLHSKEISQMLSEKSVAIGGFDLCIRVLDVLEEFCLKELLWGVWCGLVYCYKIHLQHLNRNNFTEVEMKFYRKLRGVAVNFELDRDTLHKDCISEVEKHIEVLNISCFCSTSKSKISDVENSSPTEKEAAPEPMEVDADVPAVAAKATAHPRGSFSTVSVYRRPTIPRATTDNIRFDLIKNILEDVDANCTKSLLNCLLSFRFLNGFRPTDGIPVSLSLQFKVGNKEEVRLTLACLESKALSLVPVEENAVVSYRKTIEPEVTGEELEKEEKEERKKKEKVEEKEERNKEKDEKEDEEVISTPRTRSRKRAEEEMKREMRRKKRKSFEDLVQEIVQKNKERKTEKNSRRKSPVLLKRNRRKLEKEKGVVNKEEKEEIPERKLRNSKKEEEKTDKKKGKKSFKTDGKLENYFKVITKKSGGEVKKEEKTPRKEKKGKERKKDSPCCNAEKEEGERKGEIGWRQTSLKTMMNRKNKTEKGKPETRGRGKGGEVTQEEKAKGRKAVKLTGSPLSKLSPFKEVFHDHEYAKIEPHQIESFERVLLDKQERVLDRETSKPICEDVEMVDEQKTNEPVPVCNAELPKTEIEPPKVDKNEPQEEQNREVDEVHASEKCKMNEEESEEWKPPEKPSEDEKPPPEMDVLTSDTQPTDLDSLSAVADETKESELPEESIPAGETANDDAILEETAEVSGRRGRKRMRMLDSLKPSKKIKLDDEDPQEEKLPLEVTEKENLEEKQPKMSSPKKEKGGSAGRVEGSPKAGGGGGMISSRALRMIALVPESTKGSQMQWEATPRVEVLKCKKAPNVDKNSRASKMLALLSENVAEPEETEEEKVEDNRKGLTSTPNVKTPVSSLKSPKSIRKRRSIRFDDAKNETVLYQTDTPPSQILEEKEKCRRIKPAES